MSLTGVQEIDKRRGSGLLQTVYSDFRGGFNDTVSALAMNDNELPRAENVDFSVEVKAFQTRKGCEKVNTDSFDAEITDGYSWTIGSYYKKCVVMNGRVYDVNIDTGELSERSVLTDGATKIHCFVMNNKLYYGDGSELYVWGDFDTSSELGEKDIDVGSIVRNNNSEVGSSQLKHFYRALKDRGTIDLTIEDYSNTENWEDVTDVEGYTSNVVRPIVPYDDSTCEAVVIEVVSGANYDGTLSIILDAETYDISITAGDSVSTVLTKIENTSMPGWKKTKSGNGILFVKEEVGMVDDGYLDPGTTGITATYDVKVQGKEANNNLEPIKKCTMFQVHQGSMRVFAGGNPEDNGLFYSEIGNPYYFNSELNKLYPTNGYGRITALGELSDSLLVSYENGWYAWTGINPIQSATWKPLNILYGCVCNDSLVLTPNSFMFLSKNGIYKVDASILNYELVLLQTKQIIKKVTENRVENTIKSIYNHEACKAIFYDNIYYLAYNVDEPDVPKNQAKNTRILRYEWDTQSFSIVTGWQVNQWLSDPMDLYFATKNYILKTDVGYSDIDVETGEKKPIEVRVSTKDYALGAPLSDKEIRSVGFIFKQETSDRESKIDAKLVGGYERFAINDIDISESLVYGRSWGKTWGFRESVVKVAEVVIVSNIFSIEFTKTTLDDPITLIGVGFSYRHINELLPNKTKDDVLWK